MLTRVMSRVSRDLRGFLLALLAAALLWGKSGAPAGPPPTRTDNVKDVLHGVEVVDPYRWLEDQQSSETRAWIDAQNAYTQSLLGTLPGRDQLKQRLTELIRVDSIDFPRERNGRYFFMKRKADQDLSVLYMRKGIKGKDEVLLDPHPMSADHTTWVTLEDISPDGRLVAYGVRQGGQDEITVKLLDVDTRQNLPDVLPQGRYFDVAVKADRSGVYYSRLDAEGPRVYYHALGADPAADKEIFGQGYGPGKQIAINLSEDGRYLLIHADSEGEKTEIYVQDVAGQGPVTPIVNDLKARFSGQIGGDTLFLQTDWNAPNWRILAVNLKNPARENWREVVPESGDVIDRLNEQGVHVGGGLSLAGGRLFVAYLHNVRSRVRVFEPDGRPVRQISFPALGGVSGIVGRWGSTQAFYDFVSFHIPTTIYRYDTATGAQDVWAKENVPVDTSNFMVRQVWYESKDGTLVPMFLVHKEEIELDGSNPTLLYGYGGFTATLTSFFSPTAVAWVERGGVYAVANLRGGGEFGEKWHRAGMRENKQNVFDDFIAAAEWLIANGYTSPERLAISGDSNGGLLVGAALTQRPDLFQAVICEYPLLDMIRYHQFLVARDWVPEYGSAEDPEQFKYLLKYSPYQNVKPGTRYPAVLFITGDSDTRVAPLHARKMAARLQAATASGRPVLLHYDTKSGHSGGQPVSKQIEDLTDSLGFLFWQLGVAPGGGGNKSVLVLSLQTATQAQRCSNATLNAEVFTDANSVKAYYPENSYGLASISGAVSGPYTITIGNSCSENNWAIQADSAATAAGVNVSAYDEKVYVLPPEATSLCPGRAGYVNGGRIWIREDACDSKFVIAHEIGHSFVAEHARTSGNEYGDLSSVMSGIFDGLVDQQTYLAMFNATPHFTAPQKIYEGWLPAANVQTVTVAGSYKVALLENARTDVQALKVLAGKGTYYCSYRRAVGFDSSLLTQYVDKTSVHTADNSGGSTLFANLGDGQSFSGGKFTVTQTSHDATFAYLTVSFP